MISLDTVLPKPDDVQLAGVSIALSEIDEMRFGVRTVKANIPAPKFLSAVLDYCHERSARLLIARCSTQQTELMQGLERAGGLLTDTLVYYSRTLCRTATPLDNGRIPIRESQSTDADAVETCALRAFSNYPSHYHADQNLDRADCDAVYGSWARSLCLRRSPDSYMLVAGQHNQVLGFAALRLNSSTEGEGVLFGVHPDAQGLGIYSSFLVRSLQWCRSKGARRMLISTQITNVQVQRAWSRIGFEPLESYYTFHLWLH